MAKRRGKTNSARSTKKKDILDTITPDDAFVILKSLAHEDKNMKRRIEQLAIEYLEDVDIEEIADEVYFDLDFIEVEELWDRSGSTRDVVPLYLLSPLRKRYERDGKNKLQNEKACHYGRTPL